MRSDYTGHITPSEWRWVIIYGGLLVVIAFMPLVWALGVGATENDWQFMGVLHISNESAADLMLMAQGGDENWLIQNLFTPEPHNGTLSGILYALLGVAARVTALPESIVFHIARIGVAMLMYMTLYQFAASIWIKLRTRRTFFMFAAIGSGFGWILLPLTGETGFPDLVVPGMFPFFSTLVNVHFPLTIACLALLSSVMVVALRPGFNSLPGLNNGGVSVFLLSLLLAFVYPLALVPLTLAFAACLAIYWYTNRRILMIQVQWFMWFSIPALPLMAYYFAVGRFNPVMAQVWQQQNSIAAPLPWVLVAGLGLPFLIALPGLYRAVRRFEPDGDRFMLIWLVAMFVLGYIPGLGERRLLFGMMIPLTYFAIRSIEDFWFRRIPRRWFMRLLISIMPVLAASNILVLILPVNAIAAGDFNETGDVMLQRDYIDAFIWLGDRVQPSDVILASPVTSLWVPPRVGVPVVYGHPQWTVQAQTKQRKVEGWFSEQDPKRCDGLLTGALSYTGSYTVRYVLYGPQERQLGQTMCLDALSPMRTFGDVQVYFYMP